MDFAAYDGIRLDVTPDVLIVPSALRFFSKIVEKSVCINPGQAAKRNSAGTFCKLTIHPIPATQIPTEECDIPSFIHQRMKAEIVRI